MRRWCNNASGSTFTGCWSRRPCPLLALSGHCACAPHMSAFDPKRTLRRSSVVSYVQSATIISNKVLAPLMPHRTNASDAEHRGNDPGRPQQPIGCVGGRRFGGGTISSARVRRTSRATRPFRMRVPIVFMPALPPSRAAAPAARESTNESRPLTHRALPRSTTSDRSCPECRRAGRRPSPQEATELMTEEYDAP